MRAVAVVLLVVVVAAALTACGGSSSTTTTTSASGKVVVSCHTRFAKAKFALHSGIAVGAFYRYIYRPYRAGAFKSGAPGRKKALVKAAASAALVTHELRLAAKNARCDGAALKRVADPLSKVLTPLDSLGELATGNGLGAIATAQAALSAFTKASGNAGVPVRGSG
jgi:hypothetical protein